MLSHNYYGSPGGYKWIISIKRPILYDLDGKFLVCTLSIVSSFRLHAILTFKLVRMKAV